MKSEIIRNDNIETDRKRIPYTPPALIKESSFETTVLTCSGEFDCQITLPPS
jgi:hypothetical protein